MAQDARCEDPCYASPTWSVITSANRFDYLPNDDTADLQFNFCALEGPSCYDTRFLSSQDNLQGGAVPDLKCKLQDMSKALIRATKRGRVDDSDELLCRDESCVFHRLAPEDWSADIDPCSTQSPGVSCTDFGWMDTLTPTPLSTLILPTSGVPANARRAPIIQHYSSGVSDLPSMSVETEVNAGMGKLDEIGHSCVAGGASGLTQRPCVVSEIPAILRRDRLDHHIRPIEALPGPIDQASISSYGGFDICDVAQDTRTLHGDYSQPTEQYTVTGANRRVRSTRKRKLWALDTSIATEAKNSYLLEGLVPEMQATPIPSPCRARKDLLDFDINVKYTGEDDGDVVFGSLQSEGTAEQDMGSQDNTSKKVTIDQENVGRPDSVNPCDVLLNCKEAITSTPMCKSRLPAESVVSEDEALVKMMGWFLVDLNLDLESLSPLSVHWVVDQAPYESDLPHLELLENSPPKFWSPSGESTNRPPVQISYLQSEPSQSSHPVRFFLHSSPALPEEQQRTSDIATQEEVHAGTRADIDGRYTIQRNSTAIAGSILQEGSSSMRRQSTEMKMDIPADAHEKSADTQLFAPASTTNCDKKTPIRDLEEDSQTKADFRSQAEEQQGMGNMQDEGESRRVMDIKLHTLSPLCAEKPVMESLKAGTQVQELRPKSSKNDTNFGKHLTSSSFVQCKLNADSTLPHHENHKRTLEPWTQAEPEEMSSLHVFEAPSVEKNFKTRLASVPTAPLSDISNHGNLAAALRESLNRELESHLEFPRAATDIENGKHLVPQSQPSDQDFRSSLIIPHVSIFNKKLKITFPRSVRNARVKGTRREVPICRQPIPLQERAAKGCPEKMVGLPRKTHEVDSQEAAKYDGDENQLKTFVRTTSDDEDDSKVGSEICESKKQSSKYRGVTRHRHTGRFEAHLWDNTKVKLRLAKRGRQGAYKNEGEAAKAHDLAALKYWGLGIFTNFPISVYKEDLKIMQGFTRDEYILLLRRKSPGFTRGISKYRGVTRHHQDGRWEARIGRHSGAKYHYLGTYATQEEAARAYDRAAVLYRGANAVTNFDISDYLTRQTLSPHMKRNLELKMANSASPDNVRKLGGRRKRDIQVTVPPTSTMAISSPASASHASPGGKGRLTKVHDTRKQEVGGSFQYKS